MDAPGHRPGGAAEGGAADGAAVLEALAGGELEVLERMPWSSNATFLAVVHAGGDDLLAVYKPLRGERPLWDFPPGTLGLREVACYEISEASGWSIVPPTLLRDGPYGEGMVQRFVEHDPDEHYLTLRDACPERFRQMAAFDVVVNNADRKSGHCLRDASGKVWGVDHGVTFHPFPKLRTVIWDFVGERLPRDVVEGLCRLEAAFDGPLRARLAALLDGDEIACARARVRSLLTAGVFPGPETDYPYPWPLV